MEKISIAIISSSVGKTPEQIISSFVFDEAYRLAIKGINVHIIRNKIERAFLSYGMHFHGIDRKINFGAILLILKNLSMYPKISFLSVPVYSSNVSKVIEDNRIDLIHAHFAYPEGLVGLLARRRTRKSLVVTLQGYDILVEPSIGYGLRRINRKRPSRERLFALIKRVFNDGHVFGDDGAMGSREDGFRLFLLQPGSAEHLGGEVVV